MAKKEVALVCQRCNGTGISEQKRPCPVCDGTGINTLVERSIEEINRDYATRREWRKLLRDNPNLIDKLTDGDDEEDENEEKNKR